MSTPRTTPVHVEATMTTRASRAWRVVCPAR